MEVVDYLNAKGEKVGVVSIHLYRPFSVKHFLNALPKTVKKIAVMDRTKEAGSIGEPLYLEIQSALYNSDLRPTTLVVVMVLVVKMLLQIKSLQFIMNSKKMLLKMALLLVSMMMFLSLLYQNIMKISTLHQKEQLLANSGA